MALLRVARRERSQSVVEFGIVALLFVLLMFAIVDFGFLLNSWVRLSSATRDIAREASVGGQKPDLQNMANQVAMPALTTELYGSFTGYCCGPNDKLVLQVTYFNQCIPGAAGPPPCTPLDPGMVDSRYWGGSDTGCAPNCPHPIIGDSIQVTFSAPGFEVLTPLVRPFFGCDGSQAHCNVQLSSSATMRFEGQ